MVENKEPDGDEKGEPEPFGGGKALAKAREGKDAWNEWANKNKNAGRTVVFRRVDFTADENKNISFDGFMFPGDVDFSWAKFRTAQFEGAIFKREAEFTGIIVEEIAWFRRAVFNGDAQFTESLFKGNALFRRAFFKEDANFAYTSFENIVLFHAATFEAFAVFTGATFAGPVYFQGSQFRIVPDFRGTNFQKHVTLHGIAVDFRRPTEAYDAAMYRRLKELAFTARDHDREQMFFAYELIAKRGHETRGLRLIPNYLYEFFGGFGRSLALPCFWLIGVLFGFGILYFRLATKDTSHLWDGLLFSTAQLFPFLGASKGALGDARKALYGEEALSAGINALGMLEGALGILFLFLIGLALRNRFRI